ncbi:MAG: M23 family metallopeptidase [Anaerolineaceae bacterium]|nr:M23 family metallopeptidase [Anaerolineaceae bacterium]
MSNVSLDVPFSPIPFRARDQVHLVYELFIHNASGQELKLSRVEAASLDAGVPPLAVLEAGEIEENVRYLTDHLRPADEQVFKSGTLACVYLWLKLASETPLPASLSHKVSYTMEDSTEDQGVLKAVPVQTILPLVLSPPLRGKKWLAGNAPSNSVGHRRTIIPLDLQPHITQRFAVDWVQFGEDGMLFEGDSSENNNWYGYGAELLAVADGMVTEVQDGIIENVPLSGEMAIEINIESAPGNYVLLDLGDENFALYAHMLPNSLQVKVGERVQRGQVLGRMGNSGNSDAPHLHFHIGNRNAALAAQGVPYIFKSFELLDTIEDVEILLEEGKPWQPKAQKKPENRTCESVLENDVVNF